MKMDCSNSNRKRPAPSYSEFAATKRQQQNATHPEDESLFLPNDDDDLFAEGHASNLDFLTDASSQNLPESPRPQDQARLWSPINASATTTSRTPQSHRPQLGSCAGAILTSISPCSNGAPNNPVTTTATVEIKHEKDEPDEPDGLDGVGDEEKVKIFVGRKNHEVYARRGDLKKSPVLESYIVSDPTFGQISYIMRPQLAATDPVIFESVLEFLRSGEYAPTMVESINAMGETIRHWENISSNEKYADQLVKAGKLYVYAQRFRIKGMENHVYGKITGVDIRKFPLKSLLKLAAVIFDDKRAGVPAAAEKAEETKDKLEVWLIALIARRFRDVMQSYQKTFWEVERTTRKTLFLSQVLEEVADQYRTTGGILPQALVELD